MLIRKLEDVKTVEWGNGLSRRFLLEADGMGYTVTDTIVNEPAPSPCSSTRTTSRPATASRARAR